MWRLVLDLRSAGGVLDRPAFVSLPAAPGGRPHCASRCPADANVLFGDNAVDANYSKPNVLFVGDSISGQIEPQARRLLAAHDLGTTLFASTGKDGYCGTSVGLLACVDPYLAAGNFTVAHVNWGMRDIAWKMYAKVTRGAYAAHMETLYWKLRSSMPPNATIIWATTTPVPPSYDNRKNSDVLEVNDIIRSLFGPAGKYREVIINDQYGTLVDACASRRNASDCFPETCDCPEVHKHEDIHLSELGARAPGVAAAAKVATYRSRALRAKRTLDGPARHARPRHVAVAADRVAARSSVPGDARGLCSRRGGVLPRRRASTAPCRRDAVGDLRSLRRLRPAIHAARGADVGVLGHVFVSSLE